MELQELINKWEEEIARHKRIVKDPLMWTKQDRLKSSYQVQAICALLSDVKRLRSQNASQQRELLIAFAMRKLKKPVSSFNRDGFEKIVDEFLDNNYG